MIFIVLIELVRTIIRPITLAVRLIANIVAGHLLIALLSSAIAFIPSTLILAFIAQAILITLEIAVSLIQAYVYILLVILYRRGIK
jgi:F-type H+-transporting ATPase subunit a